MTDNPEKPVLDDIDELIAQGLDEHGVPLDDYSKDRYVKCSRCHSDWHGLPTAHCPGEEPGKTDYQVMPCPPGARSYIGYMTTEYEGETMQVHIFSDGCGGAVGMLLPMDSENPTRGLRADLIEFDGLGVSFYMFPFGEQRYAYLNPLDLQPISHESSEDE